MSEEHIATYFHYLSFMFLFGALVAEHLLFKIEMTAAEVRKLAVVDAIYGLSAIAVLVTGLYRLFYGIKGVDFYLSNPAFHAKATVFILMAVASIYPTIKILKAKKAAASLEDGQLLKMSKGVKHSMRLQLLLIAAMPLLGIMIANGIGISS